MDQANALFAFRVLAREASWTYAPGRNAPAESDDLVDEAKLLACVSLLQAWVARPRKTMPQRGSSSLLSGVAHPPP